ncbi:hypothetical protein Taro_003631 [Colocasia esculenta]|uniref:Chlororespiratory reduction 21 n=1 Tax=Colocasia esculenta TaxID=4460 RepID=A0A843TG16_COLES|nr:hypothetical protein [Colocasia esculenta]
MLLFRRTQKLPGPLLGSSFPPSNLRSLPLSKAHPRTSAAAAALSDLLRSLQLSIDRRSVALARQAHALAFPLGLHSHPILSTRLVTAYSHLGSIPAARLVFEGSAHRGNALLWNAILAAYSRGRLFGEPLVLLRRMVAHTLPDDYTIAIVAKAAGEVADLRAGGAVHSLAVRLGFVSNVVLLNSVMGMYFKCGEMDHVRSLFEEMPARSVVSWNLLISAYVGLRNGVLSGDGVWDLVVQMQQEGLKPDAFTVSTILPLCNVDSGSGLLRGREIHCFVLRSGLELGSELDFYVGSSLIDMYSKGGNVTLGRLVFDRMASKNVVAWTAMISGYVQNGGFEEALILFRSMQLDGIVAPNRVTLLSILQAVGSLASLMAGKQVHGFAVRAALVCEPSLNNALIVMYSKCGSLDSARRVFDDDSWHKDAISWSSIVSGYGSHGRGEEAISLFHEMCRVGIKLDHITCVGVLSACGRSGLVTEGLKIYYSLVNEHKILPTAEICSCVVDMLCRAGRLSRALDFIYSMPSEASPSVWGSLFGFSLIHGDKEMQDLAYNILLQLEPDNPSNYVSVSNIHASSGRWDIVAEVRTRMKDRGFRKLPGCSWISLNDVVHSFYVADKSHRCSYTIYSVLDSLTFMMREAACVPDIEFLNVASV